MKWKHINNLAYILPGCLAQCHGNAFSTDQARERQIAFPEFAQLMEKNPPWSKLAPAVSQKY